MIIEISEAGATLLDAANFKDLKILIASGLDVGSAEAALRKLGDVDGDHAWVDPQWLSDHGPDESTWRQNFAAMLRFADSKGWLDSAGRVRVHIER